MKISRLRKAIAILQVFPIIVSAISVVDTALDVSGIYLSELAAPFFGVSLFTLYCMYRVASMLFVNKWSLLLYIALIISSALYALADIFKAQQVAVTLQELAVAAVYIGTASSFATYLYGKFKQEHKI